MLSFIQYNRLVADAANCIQDIIGEGKSQQEAWNSCTVRLFWAARVCLSFCIKQWWFFLIFKLAQKDTFLYLFSSFIFFLKAFCHAFVVENFVNTVSEKHLDEKTREVLTSLCRLYGVHGIITNLGEFIQVVSCAFVYFYLRSRSEDE